MSAALLITRSFLGILSLACEFPTLLLPSLLLCSSPCPSSAFFQQDVSFRHFPGHLCCCAHHPVLLWHSFSRTSVSDASLAISAALLITMSFFGILSAGHQFQTPPLPSMLLCSSPCPSQAFFHQLMWRGQVVLLFHCCPTHRPPQLWGGGRCAAVRHPGPSHV
jgi:hypothetical protein